MSNFPQYNVNNEHQLIRRQNTYVVDRKLVTIHSEDRDIKKWPQSNHFEIELPDALTNIQSVRLVEIGLPNNQYIFSNNQQNTKYTKQNTQHKPQQTTKENRQKTTDKQTNRPTYTKDKIPK